jgi:hypothetical protein
MSEKKCCRCQKFKTVDDFYKCTRMKDGFKPLCKSCQYKEIKQLNSKVECSCGKLVQKYYQKNHLLREIHKQSTACITKNCCQLVSLYNEKLLPTS